MPVTDNYGTQFEANDEWVIGGSAVFVQHGDLRAGNCDVLYHVGDGFRLWNPTFVGVSNSIFWGNDIDLGGFPCTVDNEYPDVSYCDIQSGQNDGFNNCFSEYPMFERGFYRAVGSPCADAGGATASHLDLASRTTIASGTYDSGIVDIGYHFFGGLDWAKADFYVSEDGDDTNDGTSWATAFRTITKALSKQATAPTFILLQEHTPPTLIFRRLWISHWLSTDPACA